MGSSEIKNKAPSGHPAHKSQQDEPRSRVLAEVSVVSCGSPSGPPLRASDELSDDEAEAFFFV